jgi:hypothetical protein
VSDTIQKVSVGNDVMVMMVMMLMVWCDVV